MLNRQLDVCEVLKAINLNKILRSALLYPEQRLLMLYQRKNVVEVRDSAASHTSSSDQEERNLTRNF